MLLLVSLQKYVILWTPSSMFSYLLQFVGPPLRGRFGLSSSEYLHHETSTSRVMFAHISFVLYRAFSGDVMVITGPVAVAVCISNAIIMKNDDINCCNIFRIVSAEDYVIFINWVQVKLRRMCFLILPVLFRCFHRELMLCCLRQLFQVLQIFRFGVFVFLRFSGSCRI